MSRPEFPVGMVLPVGAIERINHERREYDRDPEGYERRQREAEERRREEEEREAAELAWWQQQQQERE